MNIYKEVSELYHSYLESQNELYHFGIKGMKWGVRKFDDKVKKTYLKNFEKTNPEKTKYGRQLMQDILDEYDELHPEVRDEWEKAYEKFASQSNPTKEGDEEYFKISDKYEKMTNEYYIKRLRETVINDTLSELKIDATDENKKRVHKLIYGD